VKKCYSKGKPCSGLIFYQILAAGFGSNVRRSLLVIRGDLKWYLPKQRKIFLWMLFHHVINTLEKLQRAVTIYGSLPNWCILCRKDESQSHLFSTSFASRFWIEMLSSFHWSMALQKDPKLFFLFLSWIILSRKHTSFRPSFGLLGWREINGFLWEKIVIIIDSLIVSST